MFNVHMTSTTMDLLPLVCLCLLTWSGTTFGERVKVAEGSDAILPCSFSSNTLDKLKFDWKKDGVKEVFLYVDGQYYGKGRTGQDKDFEGRVLHFQDELKNGNASIKIQNTTRTDSGNYSCTFPGIKESVVTLVVDPDPERFILKDRRAEIPGAAPEPIIRILGETKNGVKVMCVVGRASPKPDVQWQDSAGNTLTAEEPEDTGNGDIILTATVTKTDNYTCVATQKDIYHQVQSMRHVTVTGAITPPYIETFPPTDDGVKLLCKVQGAAPQPHVQWRDSAGNTLTAEEPQVTRNGERYDVIVNVTVTNSDYYYCVATQKEINHQVRSMTHVTVPVPDIKDKIEKSSVMPVGWIAFAAVVVVVIVVFVVLRAKGCISCNRGSSY